MRDLTSMNDSRKFHADQVWLLRGWLDDAMLEIDDGRHLKGALLDVAGATSKADAQPLGRYVVPGIPNLHSHAFQRAMAGLAERRGPSGDSFWTWREAMYSYASCVGPDSLRAIASQLYVEMLKAGYTQVCEFHYLHHQPDGRPYDDAAAMSLALLEAAEEAGIGITLLPTLYMRGGFDGRALAERQRRFGHEVDGYLRLVERLRMQENPTVRIGMALHSLRAVPTDAMTAVLDGASRLGPSRSGFPASMMPIHIHIAEQVAEVDECIAVHGARPVQWLLDQASVDARWCLIHATHLDEREVAELATSGAVAGLCPTTEANLGDGLFPLGEYLAQGGIIGIGSDSQISVSPIEELRWLEYGQRLVTRSRNVATSVAGSSVGESLLQAALAGGAQASGMPIGQLSGGDASVPSVGHRADFVVLDDASPLLAGRDSGNVIDSWIFSGNSSLVRDVYVNGRCVVRGFAHAGEARIAARFRATLDKLAD
ncbi:MAG: formimidoylglutamate deiminase [Dokdonella sp.]